MSALTKPPRWSIVYEGAIQKDGSLFFPEKLSLEVLKALRKTMGPYKYANQYLNITIPDEDQDFKKSWLRGYNEIPPNTHTFIFVDPAISLSDSADYTATVVVDVDADHNWYVRMAYRQRITATETVRWIFKLYREFKPMIIGIEDVAYQASLLHFMHEEMLKTNTMIPLKGVKRSTAQKDGTKRDSNSKPFRIRSLVPRFEMGKILLNQSLDDFIMEYTTFPRGAHDDLLDALASIEEIVVYPAKQQEVKRVRSPNDPGYEKQFIESLKRRQVSNDY